MWRTSFRAKQKKVESIRDQLSIRGQFSVYSPPLFYNNSTTELPDEWVEELFIETSFLDQKKKKKRI